MPEIAIRTQRLTRRFGNLTAVDGVDLQVAAGQFFGFLGPNGAGKSTTIKMLTGLLAPTAGTMDLLGLDFATHPVAVTRRIGVLPRGVGHIERLTGSENWRLPPRSFTGRGFCFWMSRSKASTRSQRVCSKLFWVA